MNTNLTTTPSPKVAHGSLLAPWMWKRIRKLQRSLVRYVCDIDEHPESLFFFGCFERYCVHVLLSCRKNIDNTQTPSPSRPLTTTLSWCRPKSTSFRGVTWVYHLYQHLFCNKINFKYHGTPGFIALLPYRFSIRGVWKRFIKSIPFLLMCPSSFRQSVTLTTSAM